MEHEQKMKWSVKILFVVSMLTVNIWFITLPSIKMYFDYGIVIEVSTETLDDMPSPAFTVGRIGPDGKSVIRNI